MTVGLQSTDQPPTPPVEITTENIETILAAAGCHGKDFPATQNKPASLAEMKDYGPAASPHGKAAA